MTIIGHKYYWNHHAFRIHVVITVLQHLPDNKILAHVDGVITNPGKYEWVYTGNTIALGTHLISIAMRECTDPNTILNEMLANEQEVT